MSLFRIFRSVVADQGVCPRLVGSMRFASTAEKKSEEQEVVYGTLADEDNGEEVMIEREAVIQALRNKSRLSPPHQNIIHGKVPYDEPMTDAHLTLLYKKKMFGRYGRSSGFDPGYLWPTPEEVATKLEYDRIANPYSVMELTARERAKVLEEEASIAERQQKIVEKMKKLDQWKKDVVERAAKKLKEVSAAKAKKEALIEEVRRHFGFKIDPKDERFKEVLLQKERALKKKAKEEKSKARQERLLQSMMEKKS
uniref:Large ribosomal subunit protein mL64 n=1 Tax=Lygus hesperus TaxID=30085 RepID=A0A0A9WQI7_LYGHE